MIHLLKKFVGNANSQDASQFFDIEEVKTCTNLAAKEVQKTPMRYDIINYLLNLTEKKRYLEIGVRDPRDCFDRIDAREKYSVDPGFETKQNLATFKMTSDEFFSGVESRSIEVANTAFDVIFLDGLHLADQAYRDMINCLGILSSPGFLVVHDCNPPTIHHARENFRAKSPAGPYWNGTTWKAFVQFRMSHLNRSFVIDTDWGVGVICKHILDERLPDRIINNPFFEFNSFDANRKEASGLIAFEEIHRVLQ